MLWKSDLLVSELGKGAKSEAVKYLFISVMYGGGVCSILLLALVARCLETIEVCIWCMFVFMSAVVNSLGVCGNVYCVAATYVLFRLGVLKCVVCVCKGCDGCCVLCLYCDAWNFICLCKGSVSVLSYRCCILMSVSAFIICRSLCACTEILWMCVMYVCFGSKVRPRTFKCVAMGSVQWTECNFFCMDLVWDCYVLSRQKLLDMVVCIWMLNYCSCRCVGDVICVGHDLDRCSGWWKSAV